MLRYIEKQTPKKAVVVGGGYIGLEVAENLCSMGLQVSIVEAADQVAIAYGKEVADRVCAHLTENGVTLYAGDEVEKFTGDGRVGGVKFGEEELEADLVILGVGIKPHVSLAEKAGIEIGPTGAIRVDEHLKTSLPDVWAAGDCVETTNVASGEPTWVPLGDTQTRWGGSRAPTPPPEKARCSFRASWGPASSRSSTSASARPGSPRKRRKTPASRS